MRLQDLCDEMVGDVDGAMGCALVDLSTGLPLAISVTENAVARSVMEVLAAVGTEYFRGPVNRSLRTAMRDSQLPEGFVQEVQTTTDDSYHFMCVVPGKELTVLILVTDRTANLGLGWVSMRAMLERVRAATSPGERGAGVASLHRLRRGPQRR